MDEGNELESQDNFMKTQRKKVTSGVADPVKKNIRIRIPFDHPDIDIRIQILLISVPINLLFST